MRQRVINGIAANTYILTIELKNTQNANINNKINIITIVFKKM